jgi:hypothetical protein
MLWFSPATRLEHHIRNATHAALKSYLTDLESTVIVQSKLVELKKVVTNLEIERDKKLEEFERWKREAEHKIGLERKRQEFEIEASKREATVTVREANLEADKERFKSEMEFQRTHLQGEIGSLRELVSNLLERLPTAKTITRLKGDVSVG